MDDNEKWDNEKWREPQLLIRVFDDIEAVRLFEALSQQDFDYLNIRMQTGKDASYEISCAWSGSDAPNAIPGQVFLRNLGRARLFVKAFKLGYNAST